MAIFASFFHCQKKLKPKRGTSRFSLAVVPQMVPQPEKLGPVADVLARSTNPLPDARPPSVDWRAREPDFETDTYPPGFNPAATTWQTKVFIQWALGLPDGTIKPLAIDTIMQRLDPGFKGDKARAVRCFNSKEIVGREQEIRAHLKAEADLGRV